MPDTWGVLYCQHRTIRVPITSTLEIPCNKHNLPLQKKNDGNYVIRIVFRKNRNYAPYWIKKQFPFAFLQVRTRNMTLRRIGITQPSESNIRIWSHFFWSGYGVRLVEEELHIWGSLCNSSGNNTRCDREKNRNNTDE